MGLFLILIIICDIPFVKCSVIYIGNTIFNMCMAMWHGAGIAQSLWRLATGWKFQGSNPGVGTMFSAHVQTDPGTHPASCTMDNGFLSQR